MMKRQTIKFVGAALLGVAVFASCQDYTPDEQAIIKRKTVADYEKAFYAEFPNIDPEQNWGFGPMPICGEDVDITRGMNTNSNEWESVYHYEVPGGLTVPRHPIWGWAAGDISNYERAYVYWWFSTHQWPQTLEVRWSEFFVENVWGQPEHSNEIGDPTGSKYDKTIKPEGSNNSAPDRWGMDNMHILDIGKIPARSPYDYPIKKEADALTHGVESISTSDYEEVNDFNSAGNMLEQVMYAFDVSSEDWFYQESSGGTLRQHNNWTIQYINGNYYLAFDYWHQKKNDQGYVADNYGLIKPDGYYNDWIIKISNGTHLVTSYTRRIMCEDLGDTFDWDFNDLVFDVTIYPDYAQITLQAAGGTLPIYIGDRNHEAHALFDVASNVPVNVDAVGGVKRPAVVFHLPLKDEWKVPGTNTIDVNKIPIIVDRSGKGMADNESAIVLTANKGEAPQKFACPSDTYWMKEFQNVEGIENKQTAGHPNFAKWVSGEITEEFVEGNQDASAFVTERSALEDKHLDVLYADANGMPYSVSWWEEGDDPAEIKPWKGLWEGTKTDPLNSQYTEVRSYPNYVNPDGTYMTENSSFTTYSTTFQAQAPYIYETVGQDDDPTAYSAEKIKAILEGNDVNQEAEWGPDAKTVTLETNNGNDGYVLGSGYYHEGANVLIQAVPRKYKRLVRWEDMDIPHQPGNPEANTLTTDANYTIVNLSANRHLKAHFGPKGPSRVNIVIVPEGAGIPYLDDHNEAFVSGTNVPPGEHNMHVTPATGYVFDNWNNDEDEYWNEIEFDVDGEDITLIANLRPAELYTITVQANNDSFGRVCLDNENSGKVSGQYYESELNFVRAYATPNPGYRFVEWTDDAGIFKSPVARYDFLPEEVNLIAHFESMVSYDQGSAQAPNANYPVFLATVNGPIGDGGFNLTSAVNGLSNYTKCCLEVTYSGQPGVNIGQDPYYFTLDYSQNFTTISREIVFGNSLSIQGNISKINIWVEN